MSAIALSPNLNDNCLSSSDSHHKTELYSKTNILCIELGKTRFKAACLTPSMDVNALKNVKITVGRSSEWLQKNTHLLFRNSLGNPLSELLSEPYTEISLSIFGPIFDQARHISWRTAGLPSENLKELLENETGRPVEIDSDSASWAIGAIEYLKFEEKIVTYPCLAVTLGTRVGLALIESEHQIKVIEFWAMDPLYPRLSQHLNSPDLISPRQLLEKKYLENLFGGEDFIDENMNTYRATYNQHLYDFIDDACEQLEKHFLLSNISTILIGGGHSRFVDDHQSGAKEMHVLNPQKLTEKSFSPDIIQLLGCLRMTHTSSLSISTYPTELEIFQYLKGAKADPLIDLYNHQNILRNQYGFKGEIEFKKWNGKMNALISVSERHGDLKIPFGVFKPEKKGDIAELQRQALREMENRGFAYAPQIVRTQDDKKLTSIGNKIYSCFDIELNQNQSENSICFEEMLKLISHFHNYSKNSSFSEVLQKEILTIYRERFSYFSDPQFESFFFRSADNLEIILKSAKYFASNSFKEIYDTLPCTLIHGNHHTQNIIISKKQPYFIDFDTMRTDARILDLTLFVGLDYENSYLILLQENRLFSCIEEYYGNLETIEKEYFHTMVLFSQIERLTWELHIIKEAILKQDQETAQQFKNNFYKSIARLNTILSHTPNNDLARINIGF